ncbi:MAG: class I SAM-dependent methyltransferase [Rikenellaceae bacterium]|jgi:23S rRNA (cytosine1962-C5)-methyltransferase|nr:class I SAM-dependent methyltransferase [Rikenellaceae bacterium]
MESELLTPTRWTDYELIDSGGYEKLERFGQYVLRRPEPQAIWNPSLPETEWERLTDALFSKERKGDDRGEWTRRGAMPERWFVEYWYKEMTLRMRLGLTSFKHVGIFPEQAENWEWIYDRVREQGAGANVLNLFAYTGGASLAARSAGAAVTHVDSVKQVITWSRENMEASGLDGIRWVVEDAMKFVRREVRRGNRYTGIVLDPPAYGRGPEGEKWVLEEQINELLTGCATLLERGGFVVLNLYSMGLSALLARTAIHQLFGPAHTEQFGELYLSDRASKALPLGVYYRGLF